MNSQSPYAPLDAMIQISWFNFVVLAGMPETEIISVIPLQRISYTGYIFV